MCLQLLLCLCTTQCIVCAHVFLRTHTCVMCVCVFAILLLQAMEISGVCVLAFLFAMSLYLCVCFYLCVCVCLCVFACECNMRDFCR